MRAILDRSRALVKGDLACYALRHIDAIIGLFLGVAGNLLLVLQGAAAEADGFFSARQMIQRGERVGLPFVANWAMWSDVVFLTPLTTVIATLCATQWSVSAWLSAGLFGLAVATGLHFLVYLKGPLPGAHGRNGRLSIAGWLHLLYTGLVLQIASLFYLDTRVASPLLVVFTSSILALHIPSGFVGQIWASQRHPDWFPAKPHRQLWIWLAIAAIWAVLIWRSVSMLG